MAQPTPRFAEQIALVTGAASGIGRATAILLAAEGATVVCVDVNAAGLEEVVTAIPGSGSAQAVTLDVASEEAWQTAIDDLVARHKRLDVAVNCAGISFAAPIAEMSLADWRRVLAVNLDSVFLGTKHAIRAMGSAGNGGSIVNVASAAGLKALPQTAAYGTSKAAIIHFSKIAAAECQADGSGIRVNAVAPGAVKTPIWRSMPFFQQLVATTGSEEAAFDLMARAELKSGFAEPQEIAQAIAYLASDAARFVTGTNLVIDGGYTA